MGRQMDEQIIDRQPDGQTDVQTDRQTDRQRGIHVHTNIQLDRHRQTDDVQSMAKSPFKLASVCTQVG